MERTVTIKYHLPERGKSAIHERLFGRPRPIGPFDQSKRTRGLLDDYVYLKPYGKVLVRSRHLSVVKSILRRCNVTFDVGPHPVKWTSKSRMRRRKKAKDARYLKRRIRALRHDRAMTKFIADYDPRFAQSEYLRLTEEIKEAEEELAELRPDPSKADWYLAYCRGKIAAYVRRRDSDAKHLKTLTKTLRAILRKGIINRIDLGLQLDEVVKNIESSDEADRLMMLAEKLKFGTTLWLRKDIAERLKELGV